MKSDHSDERGFYGARLRFAIVIEGEEHDARGESIVVLRAGDYTDAFGRALAIGASMEQDYQNAEGNRVKWILEQVRQVHFVMSEEIDGAEVMFAFEEGPPRRFDVTFDPASQLPEET